MEQKLLSGDNYSFKEYFRIWNNPIVFGSVLKWFLFSTLKALIIIIPLLCIIFLAGELDGTLPDERSNMWTFLLAAGGLTLALVWIVTGWHSFILPRTIQKRVEGFVDRYIPDSPKINREDLDTWIITYRGYNLAVGYRESVSYSRWKSGHIRKNVKKYIRVSTTYTEDDFNDRIIEETILTDGISIVNTDFGVYARFEAKRKYFRKEVLNALDLIVKEGHLMNS